MLSSIHSLNFMAKCQRVNDWNQKWFILMHESCVEMTIIFSINFSIWNELVQIKIEHNQMYILLGN